MKTDLLIIAGEASADQHGAALIRELKRLRPELSLWGIAGDALEAQGTELIIHQREMAFLGIGEVLRHLPLIRRVRRAILNRIDAQKPTAALLIDYPGFNLKLARDLKKRNMPVIYYISPQLWAWGKKRVEKIRRYVDLMLVLFPFEQKFYRQHGITAHYVGHPLVDYHQPYLPREFKTVTPGAAVLGLLPGSRVNEVRALLPRMAQTARLLKERGAIKKAEIIRAAQIDESLYRTILPDQADWLSLVQKPLYRALPEYDAAMVASGTATLETALYAVPMLIVYHVHALTYCLGKRLVKIPNIGLANIVAETPIAKEMIQHEFQPPAAAAYLEEILQPEQNRQIREKSLIIREKLGKPGASRRAAEIIDRFLPAS